MKIEIRYVSIYGYYEIWKHIYKEPTKTYPYVLKCSTNIWMDDCKSFITKVAIEKFKINYNEIKFTKI